MMKKNVNFNDLKATEKNPVALNIGDTEITVYQTISLENFAKFVKSVAEIVFTEKYQPYFREVAFDYNVIDYFTDINLENVSVSDFWNFFTSEEMDKILSEIPAYVIYNLDVAITNLVDYKKSVSARKEALDGFLSELNITMDEISSLTENLKTDDNRRTAPEN